MNEVSTRSYNLNVVARSRRMRGGLLLYTAGLLMAVVIVQSQLHEAWRALAFVPFMMGSLMIFQAAYATCPMRAARGERETDVGVEKVVSPEQRAHDRKRAARVFSTAAVFAIATTALLFFLP